MAKIDMKQKSARLSWPLSKRCLTWLCNVALFGCSVAGGSGCSGLQSGGGDSIRASVLSIDLASVEDPHEISIVDAGGPGLCTVITVGPGPAVVVCSSGVENVHVATRALRGAIQDRTIGFLVLTDLHIPDVALCLNILNTLPVGTFVMPAATGIAWPDSEIRSCVAAANAKKIPVEYLANGMILDLASSDRSKCAIAAICGATGNDNIPWQGPSIAVRYQIGDFSVILTGNGLYSDDPSADVSSANRDRIECISRIPTAELQRVVLVLPLRFWQDLPSMRFLKLTNSQVVIVACDRPPTDSLETLEESIRQLESECTLWRTDEDKVSLNKSAVLPPFDWDRGVDNAGILIRLTGDTVEGVEYIRRFVRIK